MLSIRDVLYNPNNNDNVNSKKEFYRKDVLEGKNIAMYQPEKTSWKFIVASCMKFGPQEYFDEQTGDQGSFKPEYMPLFFKNLLNLRDIDAYFGLGDNYYYDISPGPDNYVVGSGPSRPQWTFSNFGNFPYEHKIQWVKWWQNEFKKTQYYDEFVKKTPARYIWDNHCSVGYRWNKVGGDNNVYENNIKDNTLINGESIKTIYSSFFNIPNSQYDIPRTSDGKQSENKSSLYDDFIIVIDGLKIKCIILDMIMSQSGDPSAGFPDTVIDPKSYDDYKNSIRDRIQLQWFREKMEEPADLYFVYSSKSPLDIREIYINNGYGIAGSPVYVVEELEKLNKTMFFGGDFHIQEIVSQDLYKNSDGLISFNGNSDEKVGKGNYICSSGVTHGDKKFGVAEITKDSLTYTPITSVSFSSIRYYKWDINQQTKELQNFQTIFENQTFLKCHTNIQHKNVDYLATTH